MRVDANVRSGEDIVVTFDEPLGGPALDQYWVALQPVGASESDTSGRLILERGDRVIRLPTYTPGDFEVRLHGRYPKEDHHVVARVPVRVDGWSAKTGIERLPPIARE